MKHHALRAAAAAALAIGAGSAYANDTMPATLRPPATQVATLELLARGVQIYECRAAKSSAGLEWTLAGPEADLTDSLGRSAGRHYGGPTWVANDGSAVVGQLKARDDAPVASAIPWLLLDARSTGGPGLFAGVRSIVRLHTVGGKAPIEPCTRELQTARVPYRATYRFYADMTLATVARDESLAVPIEYAGLFPNEMRPPALIVR